MPASQRTIVSDVDSDSHKPVARTEAPSTRCLSAFGAIDGPLTMLIVKWVSGKSTVEAVATCRFVVVAAIVVRDMLLVIVCSGVATVVLAVVDVANGASVVAVVGAVAGVVTTLVVGAIVDVVAGAVFSVVVGAMVDVVAGVVVDVVVGVVVGAIVVVVVVSLVVDAIVGVVVGVVVSAVVGVVVGVVMSCVLVLSGCTVLVIPSLALSGHLPLLPHGCPPAHSGRPSKPVQLPLARTIDTQRLVRVSQYSMLEPPHCGQVGRGSYTYSSSVYSFAMPSILRIGNGFICDCAAWNSLHARSSVG